MGGGKRLLFFCIVLFFNYGSGVVGRCNSVALCF